MYFIFIVLVLSAFAFYELGKNRSCNEIIYLFVLVVMTLLLCFRYGQGTDYNSYHLQFQEEITADDSYIHQTLSHSEWGWYVLMLTTKKLGLPFEALVAFVSIVMILCLYRTLKLSPYKMTSLLLFFPTYYMTYCFSALRQGLAVCIFLAFGLKLLLERKYWKYCLLSMGLGLFHSASFILVFLPLAFRFNEKQLNRLVLLAFLGAIVLSRLPLVQALSILGTRVGYFEEAEFSIGAIMIRAILFVIIWRLHHLGSPKDTLLYREECGLYQLYYAGFILFLFFSPFGIISQRLTVPMKALEIILIPLTLYRNRELLLNKKKTRFSEMAIYLIVIIMMMNVEGTKNVNAYIEQQGYHNVSVTNYPYISIFDEDRIRQHRYLF
ncbi:MAG: EpsG family protein [Bacteroidales bacterium]|nr:EpsG family protein [Bacteroidales bacterium]